MLSHQIWTSGNTWLENEGNFVYFCIDQLDIKSTSLTRFCFEGYIFNSTLIV